MKNLIYKRNSKDEHKRYAVFRKSPIHIAILTALPTMLSSPFVYSSEPLSEEAAVAIEQETAQTDSAVQQNSESEADNRRPSSALLEVIEVTSRKRAETSQEVPLAVSALGSDQLEALKVRDLTSLTVGLPNVSFDDAGTTKGIANFSVRGLGINSSIPSIDPTVGLFVNGIYMGINSGVLFDMFDMQRVEVLRSPQGILFGRNVTGGAVLLETKKPGDEFEAKVKAAVDGGGEGSENYYFMGTVGGPVNDSLGLKLTAYINDDKGYHKNQFDGSDVQAIKQEMIRGTLVWFPTEDGELVARFERMEVDGDGSAIQSHRTNLGGRADRESIPGQIFNADEDSFELNYDEIGFYEQSVDFLSLEYNHYVDFGDGRITALYGWRDNEDSGRTDIDGQPRAVQHATGWTQSEQHSFELRYNGEFGNANVTTGLYWFDNEIVRAEKIDVVAAAIEDATGGAISSPAATLDFGGLYDVKTTALFTNIDYVLNDDWTLTLGARYSKEEKAAQIASGNLNTNVLITSLLPTGTVSYVNPATGTDTRCNIVTGPVCNFDFTDDESWNSFSPKIGFFYRMDEDINIYGHWTKGYRSGGYNLRNSSFTTPPGPFDEEEVNSFELGYKSLPDWGRLNAAVFYNTIDDMQREVLTADASAANGTVVIVDNTADATIWGVEIDATASLSESVILLASVGYTNASYDEVRFDINGDGAVDAIDEGLDLPRAPELTYSIGLTYDWDVGSWGYASARANYSYRDESAFTDGNGGIIPEQDIVDIGVDFYSDDDHWVFSIYGKNLLDTVRWGADSQRAATVFGYPFGGTFSPLAKGRVIGVEATYTFN